MTDIAENEISTHHQERQKFPRRKVSPWFTRGGLILNHFQEVGIIVTEYRWL